jgi:hypothetical protein
VEFNKLANLLFKSWATSLVQNKPQQTVGLFGSPGIGKTSAGRDLARLMTAHRQAADPEAPEARCEVLDLSSMLPEDLNGLPFRTGDTTTYCPPRWLKGLCDPDAYGVLVLDDLPAASPALQVAARQISLERRVHDHRLAPGIFVVVTGNRREDKAAASTLPSHFRNSIMMLTVELTVKEWTKWYGRQPHHAPIVAAFLQWKQDRLSMLPADADKQGAFATPRTWTMLGAQYEVAEAANALFDVAKGLVGEGIATEFAAFVKVRAELVDPEKVLDDPKGALPNPDSIAQPDKLVAMCTSLGEIAAQRTAKGAKPKVKREAPVKLLKALAWVTQDSREYCGAGVSTFINNGGDLPALVNAANANKGDPTVRALLKHLQSALLGES